MKIKKNPAVSQVQEEKTHRSTAAKLCDVAGGLFYRHGIRAVGVDEIVQESGVTKPTLYRSYSSKDELVAVCLHKKVDEHARRFDAIALRFADDPLGHVRAIVRAFAEEIATPDYRGCAITNAAVEFPEPEHPVRAVVEAWTADLRGLLFRATSRLPVTEPSALADGLMLLIEGASTIRHTSGCQGPSAALITATEALLAHYLRQAEPTGDLAVPAPESVSQQI